MADAALRWNKTLAICFAIIAHLAIAKGSDDEDFFPLLMPKVHPTLVETYLCTSIRLNDAETHYVIGFKPNATMHTAHHMLIYGCEEPGSDTDIFNCGEMAIQEPGDNSILYFCQQSNWNRHSYFSLYRRLNMEPILYSLLMH